MSSDWRTGKLGDFIELKRGYDLPQAKRIVGSVPLVSSSGISDSHAEAMVKGPGVVTGRYGTIGQVFYVPDDFWPLNTTLYVRDFKGNDPKFISYFLKTVDFFAYSDKAAVPGVNRNHLHEASAVVPPLQDQKIIAEFLGSIDDRITLLRETNSTLEAIAQALFKSWFVDFDPVRAKMEGRAPEGIDEATAPLFPDSFVKSELGLVPRGWQVISVSEVAEVVKGKSYSSKDLVEENHTALVTLKSFERGGGFRLDGFKPYTGSYKPSQVVEPGDLIVAYTDVTQAAELIGKPAIVVSVENHATLVASLDVGIVRPDPEQISRQFLYGLFRTEAFQSHTYSHTSGTTVLHLAKDGIGSFVFSCPPIWLVNAFSDVAESLVERCQTNIDQMRTLATLRDTLLPRLISGQLRLSELTVD